MERNNRWWPLPLAFSTTPPFFCFRERRGELLRDDFGIVFGILCNKGICKYILGLVCWDCKFISSYFPFYSPFLSPHLLVPSNISVKLFIEVAHL